MNIKVRRYIDIVIVCAPSNIPVAAAKVSHPTSVRKDLQWDNTTLNFFNDFIDDVISLVSQYFTITKEYQSSSSYSYYVEFEVANIQWVIRFRLSDHINKKSSSANVNDNRRRLFRSIVVGPDQEFTSFIQALDAIEDMCIGIHDGDVEVIYKSYKVE